MRTMTMRERMLAVIQGRYDRYYRDCTELGDDGSPKPEIEHTPWQQLWIEWVGLGALAYHLADWPDHVEHTKMGELDSFTPRLIVIRAWQRRSRCGLASACGSTFRRRCTWRRHGRFGLWQTSFPIIAAAIDAFGKP